MKDAVARGASDIHIEPYEESLRVRFRIDGLLREVMTPPHGMKQALTSRIKVLAGLDIAEHRLPQDGRLRLAAVGGEVDVRVSVLPTRFGEKVVLRLLQRSDLVTSPRPAGPGSRRPGAFRRRHGQARRHDPAHGVPPEAASPPPSTACFRNSTGPG